MHLLELLLQAQLVGVAATLLAAVHRPGIHPCIALTANLLVGVVLLGKRAQVGLNDATAPVLQLLDVVDRVRGLHLEGDRLAREGLHKDLHGWRESRARADYLPM